MNTGHYTQQCVKEARDHCQTATFSTNNHSNGSQYWPEHGYQELHLTPPDESTDFVLGHALSLMVRIWATVQQDCSPFPPRLSGDCKKAQSCVEWRTGELPNGNSCLFVHLGWKLWECITYYNKYENSHVEMYYFEGLAGCTIAIRVCVFVAPLFLNHRFPLH